MGHGFSRSFVRWSNRKYRRVLLIGLDGAGKTTVMQFMTEGSTTSTIPTTDFCVKEIEFEDLKFGIWDVGGQDRLRPYWNHYYTGAQAIVFIVDSNDRERLQLCKIELEEASVDEQLKDSCFLILANKQDVPGAMTAEEIEEALDLTSICGTRAYKVQPAVALTGEGLYEGFRWLTQHTTPL